MATLPAPAIQENLQPWEQSSAVQDFSSLMAQLSRGSISEIVGASSSGRTSLMQAILKNSIAQGEICALIDWSDSFEPANARRNGIDLENLLWVRGARRPLKVIVKIADLILHIGGFGVVVLDLCEVSPPAIKNIPLSWWYRLRKVIEHTPAMLVIVASCSASGPCASQVIDMRCDGALWSGSREFPLLKGFSLEAIARKPVRAVPVSLNTVVAV
jgi:hypothetical protein